MTATLIEQETVEQAVPDSRPACGLGHGVEAAWMHTNKVCGCVLPLCGPHTDQTIGYGRRYREENYCTQCTCEMGPGVGNDFFEVRRI